MDDIDYPKFENVEQTLWKNIFYSAFHTTRETKLQSFQYRILHRTFTCRKKLYDMKLVDSPNSLYCNNIDNISTFFYPVKKLETFGNLFFSGGIEYAIQKITLHYEFLEESILFGFQMNGEVFDILNYCILNGKFYIHKQKLFHENALDFYDYLWELKI